MVPVELGTEKIGKLLKQYATPAIIAMLATSLYNMVDSIYIGQGVGPMAISGLAVTFPLMNISIAFGTLVGVGAATLISILLGQKDYKLANRVLGNVVILNVVISALVTALGLIFLTPILYFFGASDNTISYAREYMVVILWGNIISHLYHGLNGVVRSSGRPRLAMAATILAVVLNTILDPIFIFVFKMGIRGAAIATVLAQVIALVWITKILCDKNNVLHFSPEVFKFDWKIAWRSLSIGMSPFLMNIASCFVVILINNQLKRYGGDLAIGAYGIANRLCFLFFTITMGLTQGMQPIAGYNYGARNWGRVKEVLRLTIFCSVAALSLGFITGLAIPRLAVSLFTRDAELQAIAARAFRITVLMFPIVGFQAVVTNFFQCVGYVRKAIFLSLSRQLLFLVPFLATFPLLWGLDGVWWSMPASDLVSAVVAFFMIRALMRDWSRKEAEQIPDNNQ
ncbi:MAG: MATE family efflux transporter [Bacteroidales bacterium]|nr:MATE family efflux transporter [Bacteroidales bacterium]